MKERLERSQAEWKLREKIETAIDRKTVKKYRHCSHLLCCVMGCTTKDVVM